MTRLSNRTLIITIVTISGACAAFDGWYLTCLLRYLR